MRLSEAMMLGDSMRKRVNHLYLSVHRDGACGCAIGGATLAMGRTGNEDHEALWPWLRENAGRSLTHPYSSWSIRGEQQNTYSCGFWALIQDGPKNLINDSMRIRDYKNEFRPSMPDDVLYAGEFLESKGFEFLKWFGTANATDRAAWLYTESMEKDSGAWPFGHYWD